MNARRGRALDGGRKLRITLTLSANVVLRLDADAKRRRRTRSRCADELLAEVLRSIYLDPADLPPAARAQLRAIQARRRLLAASITGSKIRRRDGRQSHEEARGAPVWGGLGVRPVIGALMPASGLLARKGEVRHAQNGAQSYQLNAKHGRRRRRD